ncbi:MAG TPA: DUF1127 domain-containing protein [Paracoccus sp.]|nr:DUF1127 domain-containing protein [Paracoccus sp. (in: a-proteobacteria)]
MAFLNETIHGTGPLAGFRAAFAGLVEGWTRYGDFRRTYNELNALSTRELHDLGFSRSMLARVAHEAAYGKTA